MKYLPNLICAAMVLTTITGCKKDSSKTANHITPNAVIVFSGEIAADGCGWLVKIDSTNEEYSPVNLSTAYQKDSLKVKITYHVLKTKQQCGAFNGGNGEGGITQIHLDAIAQ